MSPRVADPQRSPSVVSFLGRSVLSLRRNQVTSVDQCLHDQAESQDLELFQSFVSDRLLSLQDHLPLSFPFLHRLLDLLVSSQEEFKNLLSRITPTKYNSPSTDSVLTDLLDRSVKCLDVLSSVRCNLQTLRHWNRDADIASSASKQLHLKRTKKALTNLLASEPGGKIQVSGKADRAWSLRCKGVTPAGLTGLALAVYTMSSIIVFTNWALMMAFPWHNEKMVSSPPKHVLWAGAMMGLEERISAGKGVLAEIVGVERIGKEMMGLVMEEDREIAAKGEELRRESRRLEEGVGPLERQVREVFHRVVESRAEVMKFVEMATKSLPPFFVL